VFTTLSVTLHTYIQSWRLAHSLTRLASFECQHLHLWPRPHREVARFIKKSSTIVRSSGKNGWLSPLVHDLGAGEQERLVRRGAGGDGPSGWPREGNNNGLDVLQAQAFELLPQPHAPHEIGRHGVRLANVGDVAQHAQPLGAAHGRVPLPFRQVQPRHPLRRVRPVHLRRLNLQHLLPLRLRHRCWSVYLERQRRKIRVVQRRLKLRRCIDQRQHVRCSVGVDTALRP
jgi:hypothetical protein